MGNDVYSLLSGDEWLTVRDFSEGKNGSPLPKYEAKLAQNIDKEFLDSELVLVRVTRQVGGEEMYHIPKDTFLDIGKRIPERR